MTHFTVIAWREPLGQLCGSKPWYYNYLTQCCHRDKHRFMWRGRLWISCTETFQCCCSCWAFTHSLSVLTSITTDNNSYFFAVFKVSKLSESYCNQHVLSPKAEHFTLTVLILKMGKVLNSEVSVCKHAAWSKLSYKRGTSQAVRPFCEFVPIRRKPPRSWVKLQICTAPLVRRKDYQVY